MTILTKGVNLMNFWGERPPFEIAFKFIYLIIQPWVGNPLKTHSSLKFAILFAMGHGRGRSPQDFNYRGEWPIAR